MLETNPTFWRMVQARRRQPTITPRRIEGQAETEALKRKSPLRIQDALDFADH